MAEFSSPHTRNYGPLILLFIVPYHAEEFEQVHSYFSGTRRAIRPGPRAVAGTQWVGVLIRHDAIDVGLEVAEHWEPDLGAERVALEGPVVGQ